MLQSTVELKAAKALKSFKLSYSRFYRTGKNNTDQLHYANLFSIYHDLLVDAKIESEKSTSIIDAARLEIINLIDAEVQQMVFDI